MSARAPADDHLASSPSAPTPGMSSSRTSARPASTWPSPTWMAGSSDTTMSPPGSRTVPSVPRARRRAVRSLLRTTQDIPGRLWGIGIGVPGPVEFGSGRPDLTADHAGLGRLPGPRILHGAFGAPVWVDNDVNVMALGEWRSGSRRAIGTSWSSRSGPDRTGIISDGRLHRGAQERRGRRPYPDRVTNRPSCAGAETRLPRSHRGRRCARSRRRGDGTRRPERQAASRLRPARQPCRRRTSPGPPHSVTRSRSAQLQAASVWSAPCWPAS